MKKERKKMEGGRVEHPFLPLYDKESKILILGSFPSVKSREQEFFYGHPQNRFWKTTAGVLSERVPETVGEKKEFLHRNHIALWDVIQSCEITGSSDSSIKNVIPNDITAIIKESNVRTIFCNGAKSYQYYEKYLEKQTGIQAKKLPSTSPANAAFSLERLMDYWKQICIPLQAALPGIGDVLLKWYDYNGRLLPWRSDPTPYHIWISEIMLQQTRVEAVKKYYDRWMKELPDVAELAQVGDDTLMKLWEGLGYYNRARNLKIAAQEVMEEYGGELPGDRQRLMKLKGIGEYTSGAIASIAFGLPETSVDGNALRIFSRVLEEKEDITRPATKRKLEKEVRRILPVKRAGDFNQALMDLGSGVCLPNGRPLCGQCPWENICQAHKNGRELEFPVKGKRKDRKKEQKGIFLMEIIGKGQKKLLLHKRPGKGLLPNLWEFPNVAGKFTAAAAKAEVDRWFYGTDYVIEDMVNMGEGKHIFSHIEWEMTGYRYQLKVPEAQLQAVMREKEWILVSREEIQEQYAIPSAFDCYKKYL